MLKNFNYPINIVRTKRKTTALQVKDGEVFVRTNNYVSEEQIKQIIIDHEKWIKKKISRPNDKFSLLGKLYKIEKHFSSKKSYQLTSDSLLLYGKTARDFSSLIDKVYSDHLDILNSIINECVNTFPKKPQSVEIKRLKRSFGICRRGGYISISLYVLKYSPAFIKMVVYHELCHLYEMNHSRSFYHLLEQYVPNHRLIKKEAKS